MKKAWAKLMLRNLMVRPLPLSVKSIPVRGVDVVSVVDVMTGAVNNASRDWPPACENVLWKVHGLCSFGHASLLHHEEPWTKANGNRPRFRLDDSRSIGYSFKWSWEMFSLLVDPKTWGMFMVSHGSQMCLNVFSHIFTGPAVSFSPSSLFIMSGWP